MASFSAWERFSEYEVGSEAAVIHCCFCSTFDQTYHFILPQGEHGSPPNILAWENHEQRAWWATAHRA